jgi:hypothetical protein
VRGDLRVVDSETGGVIAEETRVALCRCSKSENQVDAGLVSKHRSGREQLVRGEVNQLRRAHELLDELETVWRARLERFEDVLNETTGKESG